MAVPTANRRCRGVTPVGLRSFCVTPRQRHTIPQHGRGSTYRQRNAVQTKPATSETPTHLALLWISGLPAPDTWGSLRQAAYPQRLPDLMRHAECNEDDDPGIDRNPRLKGRTTSWMQYPTTVIAIHLSRSCIFDMVCGNPNTALA